MATAQLQKSAEVVRLADIASHAREHRPEDIYLAVTTLFQEHDQGFSDRERGLATDILRRLAKDVEMSIRIGLAERIADDPAAPHDLVLLLADDRIEVARPILARSCILNENDLIHVVDHGSTPHQIAVAERPAIGEAVAARLARNDSEEVVVALLRNKTAKIAAPTFQTLADRARTTTRLQAPLVGRSDLPPVVASSMYLWVSGALKSALTARYPHIAPSLAHSIEETTKSLRGGVPKTSDTGAAKLIAKLSSSAQLRTSFLIRVLHQGQMDLFEHGLAALLGMDLEPVRRAIYGERPLLVALACRAIGIDRSVFMTVFNLSRHHRQIPRTITPEQLAEIRKTFETVSKSEALEKFKAAALA